MVNVCVKVFFIFDFLYRAEKVAEIASWLKSLPVSSTSRASCDLQVLDAAIVEKIEEAVEKTKVRVSLYASASYNHTPFVLVLVTSISLLLLPPQMKKSTKKVRVTVKPHLLFRVGILLCVVNCLILLLINY